MPKSSKQNWILVIQLGQCRFDMKKVVVVVTASSFVCDCAMVVEGRNDRKSKMGHMVVCF